MQKIIAGKAILLNTKTNTTFIASRADEEHTGKHPSHSHIEWTGELDIPVMVKEDYEEELKKYKDAISQCVMAICFTVDYVAPKVDLPALEGWTWFDACKKVEKLIPDNEWIKEFQKRVDNYKIRRLG